MDRARVSRPVPLALTVLVAFFSALAALAVSNGHLAHAHDGPAATAATSESEIAFRNDMRALWEDHIVWTRLAIISLIDGSPDTDATVARLLRNQTEIGDAVKPYYGDAAGDEVTRQLRGHILIAADLVLAAKAGDAAKLADAQARWQANADDIAAVLNSVNPAFWKLHDLEHMLDEHLTLTTQEAVARLEGRWEADVAAYDAIHVHALGMADTLANGIVKQFPQRFR
jgi:hypothetical protein